MASIHDGGTHVDSEGRWNELRQIADDGAVLVRPDNHVGWRAQNAPGDTARADALTLALASILGR